MVIPLPSRAPDDPNGGNGAPAPNGVNGPETFPDALADVGSDGITREAWGRSDLRWCSPHTRPGSERSWAQLVGRNFLDEINPDVRPAVELAIEFARRYHRRTPYLYSWTDEDAVQHDRLGWVRPTPDGGFRLTVHHLGTRPL